MGGPTHWFSPGTQHTDRLTKSLLRSAQDLVGRLVSSLARAEEEVKSLRGAMETVGRMNPPACAAGGRHAPTGYADGYRAQLADPHAAAGRAAGSTGRLQVGVREGRS